MDDYIAYATDRLNTATSTPELLAAAFDGLELVERAATALTARTPRYTTALSEASEAWWALSMAPSLNGPADARTEALATFALTLAQSLVAATARITDPGDRVACLQAARHLGRVHSALC
ncbi:hypothetical protein [Actinomadura hibisca]|uniref:hypothetical protein n=1 Tax=Actinomadura hibisca TaxID=68565 RepID=UPI00082FFBA3|nr:hypothetical protein [Actinomadura hibisca]